MSFLRVTLSMRIRASFLFVSIPPWRLRVPIRLRIRQGCGFALVVILLSGSEGRIAVRTSVVTHGGADARNPPFVRLHRARSIRERVCKFGGDLEARVAAEDLDGTDLGFRHIAGAAEERQQPAGLGITLAADIDPEPDHFAAMISHGTC